MVKAFQRLIYRWELGHNDSISASILRSLLENNIFGVDIDKEAVRVASFSLYMTMIDSIDPLKYWENQVRFPRLRNTRLINSDFFAEDKEGFRTDQEAATYDLVLGNAPWGKNTTTNPSKSWAKLYGWDRSITYGNIGPLFIPKSLSLSKVGGIVCMIQPAGVILFNQISTAQNFRDKLFSSVKVDEIVNLSALCYGLFKDALSPSCVITTSNVKPDGELISYICPKSRQSNEDDYLITIESQDMNELSFEETIENHFIWSTLMWGGVRDLNLVRSLSQFLNLEKLEKDGIIAKRQGIIEPI